MFQSNHKNCICVDIHAVHINIVTGIQFMRRLLPSTLRFGFWKKYPEAFCRVFESWISTLNLKPYRGRIHEACSLFTPTQWPPKVGVLALHLEYMAHGIANILSLNPTHWNAEIAITYWTVRVLSWGDVTKRPLQPIIYITDYVNQ